MVLFVLRVLLHPCHAAVDTRRPSHLPFRANSETDCPPPLTERENCPSSTTVFTGINGDFDERY